ncbi:MAG TPA: hypothetical protein VLI04_08185 [Nocardioidaceae bacterium]|nr:hypothetical protein [Nocardioidaceae bacterium]
MASIRWSSRTRAQRATRRDHPHQQERLDHEQLSVVQSPASLAKGLDASLAQGLASGSTTDRGLR